AGTYDVQLVASDGHESATQTVELLIAPANRGPQLFPAPALTVREGDPVHLQLAASDPDGDDLSYSSALLPGGAQFNPTTGLLQWAPEFFQRGVYEIPFSVSDGQAQSTITATITVLNANAAPRFDDTGPWIVQEGQQ